MSKRVLLLAYMFPPIVDAGGFRPLAFARYLPEFSWDPIVVTRPDSGRLPLDAAQLDTLSERVRVERIESGFAETWNEHFRQRLAWFRPVELLLNKPAGWLAEGIAWRAGRRDPLRQWEVSWMKPAIETGLRIIDRDKPDAILATAPPFETLKAGWCLHEKTGLPLIADFRDPWTYGVLWNPSNAKRAGVETDWEARVVRDAAKVVVVTPSMQRAMSEKYAEHAGKIELVMNGYEDLPANEASPPSDRFVLSYVGSIMERRFPAVLFEALRRLRLRHPEAAANVHVQFIGPNQCAFALPDRIRAEDLSGLVEYLGPVGHDQCREMMRESHVLLHIETLAEYAVSSKLFEYFAAGRPILGIVPSPSDDEWFLQQSGVGFNAGVSDADAIEEAIYKLWSSWRNGCPTRVVDDVWLAKFHRRAQTQGLAMLLDRVASASPQSASGSADEIGRRDATTNA